MVHLRMTGSLELTPASATAPSKPSAVFDLTGGRELRFYDPRRLGKLWLVDDPTPFLAGLGPEPLEPSFTFAVLEERLARRRPVLRQGLSQPTRLRADIPRARSPAQMHRFGAGEGHRVAFPYDSPGWPAHGIEGGSCSPADA